MQRRRYGFGGSSAVGCTLGFVVAVACNVYNESLLTGGSEGQGGSSNAGEGGEDTGGRGGSTGGTLGGTMSGSGGRGGTAGTTGGTGATGGSDTGGQGGASGGATGGKGGTDPTGGDAGETGTGGNAGSGAGSGGAGNGGNAGSGGSAGSAGDGGSGGKCGVCGCGKADTPDADMDGVLDCVDTCPNYDDAICTVLRNGLVHRYSFNGTGTAVMDTKGTAHGTAMGVNAALSGSGTIVLAGGISPQSSDPNKQYVDLPDTLLSGLTNATFEAWVTWTTPTNWQRVFDFGNAATGTSGAYVFLTLRTASGSGPRAAISTAGSAAENSAGGAQISSTMPITTAVEHHLVAIIDDTGNTASLYVDGMLGSTVGFTGTIASLAGTNNWLGRSNYTTAADPYLGGTLNEFRIYNVALTAAQLQESGEAGPNATFF